MKNPVVTCAEFWKQNRSATPDEAAILRKPGAEAAFVFFPDCDLAADDVPVLAHMHYLVISMLAEGINGAVPPDVVDSIAKVLFSAHGLGLQRGSGKVDELGFTKPFPNRAAQWEKLQSIVAAHPCVPTGHQ
jgi:hypothetical protein